MSYLSKFQDGLEILNAAGASKYKVPKVSSGTFFVLNLMFVKGYCGHNHIKWLASGLELRSGKQFHASAKSSG